MLEEQIIEAETERVKKDIAKQLESIRKGKKLSRGKFAKESFIHPSHNSELLNAKNNSTIKSLVQMGVYNNYRFIARYEKYDFKLQYMGSPKNSQKRNFTAKNAE